jgi:hypothetical protein
LKGSLELIVGDPGSGKTGYLFYRAQQALDEGYRTIVVSTVEDPEDMQRTPPLGAIEADTLEHALLLAEDYRHAVICFDEVGLEVDDNQKPSPQLKLLGRFRRHVRIRFFMTTQRPFDIPPKVRDLDVSIVLMKMEDKSSFSAKWIKREFGEDIYDQAAELDTYYYRDRRSQPPQHERHYLRVRG